MNKLKITSLMVVGFLFVAGLLGFGWLKSSLPKTNGTVIVAGISGEITIARDEHGVPHISAETDNDLYFAAGYVHAQDRLWQMMMNRRIGRGRLSELAGSSTLSVDKFFRTLGFKAKAEKAYDNLPSDLKQSLHAYADGVNAYIKDNKSALPPEFILTGTEPELWHPVDSLIWHKMMWLDLSGNMRQEIARARLLTKLPPEKVMSIYATYPGDTETALPDLTEIYKSSPIEETAFALGKPKPEGYGSNNWLVDGTRTQSGKPLLANDPHLGLTTPSIWYLMRLYNTTTHKNIVGVSFPGTPVIVLGRNDAIAWGFTNTAPDSQDLFIEKLAEGGDKYHTPNGLSSFDSHEETIIVKDAEPVTIQVRTTRHGPVVSDIHPETAEFVDNGYVIALQWTALQDKDTAIGAMIAIGKAQNFEQFKEAGKLYFGPEQNMIYADIEGNVGYYAPALVPIRHPDNKIAGRIPSPGWDALYDWQGYIPYEDLPTRYNPKGGIIATANEKIVGQDYPYFITRDWSLPYRGNRIRHLLESTEKHTVASFSHIQNDITSDMARDILPLLLTALDQESPAFTILKNWDGRMNKDSPEPLIFQLWLSYYQHMLMADELGELYDSFTYINPRLIKSSLYWSLSEEKRPAENTYFNLPVIDKLTALSWCNNKETPDRREICTKYARSAMSSAIADLSDKYGPQLSTWKWGTEHILHQEHRPFSNIDMLKPYFEISAAVSGGTYTVNVAGVSTKNGARNTSTFGPSYRGIFDLSDLDRSRYIQPTGQSGNPLSRHYKDMFKKWAKTESFEIPTNTPIPAGSTEVLQLIPKE
ncbi:penicillin acylase family protein [Kordiimonas pumila]|uniref:Penicillin acylase family protein n=1 Tax=Kordiimonas pumila TaxID=2161677 RepID=A0ABV7D0V6_9PROT|nr:penicillin acylase family protein [Kordiimonas pumila]